MVNRNVRVVANEDGAALLDVDSGSMFSVNNVGAIKAFRLDFDAAKGAHINVTVGKRKLYSDVLAL